MDNSLTVRLNKKFDTDAGLNKGNNNYWLITLRILIVIATMNTVSGYSQEKVKSNESETGLTLKSTDIKKQLGKVKSNGTDWFYTGLEVNYVLLNALDLITTFNGLEDGAREANPITRLYINNKPLAVIIKGSMTAGILYGLTHVKRDNKKAAYITLGLLNVIYGFVVQNNIGVYLQLRR